MSSLLAAFVKGAHVSPTYEVNITTIQKACESTALHEKNPAYEFALLQHSIPFFAYALSMLGRHSIAAKALTVYGSHARHPANQSVKARKCASTHLLLLV